MRTLLCGLLVAGLACAAAPPARLAPERVRLLHERPWFAVTEKTLEIESRVYGPWHRQVEKTAERLGDQWRARGDWAREAEGRRAVVEARRKLYGTADHRTVDARVELSEALAQAKRTPAQREAVARARALNEQAMAEARKGQLARAVPLAKRALRIKKEVLGERHPSYALSLNNLAFLYQASGDHKTALPLFEQALHVKKEVLGEKHPSYATSLNNLAILHQKMGRHNAALPLFRRSLAICKEALGDRHPDYADGLNNIAELYRDMGDYKRALPLARQAVQIRKEALGEKHPAYATGLNNLAALSFQVGEHRSALRLFREALDVRKEALGEKHPLYANVLINLSELYKARGDGRTALPLCQRALAIYKEALGEGHPDYANGLNNLASLYESMGDHKQALSLYTQALKITRQALGEKHTKYALGLHNRAALLCSLGDRKAARPLAEEASALTLSLLRASAAAQSDRQQLVAAERLRHRLDLRLSLLDVEGYAHVLAWKGAVLLRQRQRRLFSALSANPSAREAAEELQATARQIAALSTSSRPAREQLERLTKQQERLQAELSRLSAEARAAFKAEALTPQALSTALPEGAVLVDYLFYRRYGLKGKGGKPQTQRHLVAFVSRGGKPTVRVDLGPANKVEDALRQWLPLLTRGQPGKPFAAEVKGLIWSPLEKHLAGAKVVLISPDGLLASAPFAALPGAEAGTYLVEDVAVAVVPVPQMLPEMLKPVDKAKRLKPSLLVVGDVDYDRAGPAVRVDGAGDRGAPLGVRRDWGKLPATFAESAAVSKSFAKLFAGKVTDLDGANATKARVRHALAKVRYAHLATHGFFAQQDIRSAFKTEVEADGLFGREGAAGWHPLLLSGLVLAGANREPKPGEEDGILTALEVSEMQLPGLELVVLSACETGLGKSAGGEGLLGLQRAFQVAGARTVIASLWAVDDRATQALMAEFYRVAWDTDTIVSRAEALRRAQLSILKEGKSRGLGKKGEKLPEGETRLPPVYWAAFVLSGDWR